MLMFSIGLPRSGKSTYANNWAKECPMRVIVSSDNIRLAMTGKRYEPLAETMVFATKHIMIRSLLDRGFDVFVDGTHSTEISITRLYEIDINAKEVFFKTSRNECVERAFKTAQPDLIPIIDRINDNIRKLRLHDDIWRPIKLTEIREAVQKRGLYANHKHYPQ